MAKIADFPNCIIPGRFASLALATGQHDGVHHYKSYLTTHRDGDYTLKYNNYFINDHLSNDTG